MFKGQNAIWGYLIGLLIMFGVLILFGQRIVPFIFSRKSINLTQDFNDKPNMSLDLAKDYLAKITTTQGQFIVDLYEKNSPNNVNNFVYLSSKGFYTRTKFHRLVPDFLVQGGDRNTLDDDISNDGKGRPGYLIDDEINWDSLNLSSDKKAKLESLGFKSTPGIESRPLERFSLVMANSGPNTNGSQFFIISADFEDSRLDELNGMFTTIGKVISGGDVIDKINEISVDNADSNSPRPTKDIIIESIEVYTR
jgi:cyclophilin family peptidyl-prolyl cis-trans isomerase